MVARSPPKLKKMVAPINPLLLRETLTKVDRCMSRLQELQNTVTGGRKLVNLKQESLRIKNETPKKSPVGKFRTNTTGEWRRISLPAMLVGETVGEIIKASQFAKQIVEAANGDPKTPATQRRKQRPNPENTNLRTRRKMEKQITFRSPMKPERVRSRINFKLSSPPKSIESETENSKHAANRVSPKLKPWAKKAVLFPNPLFLSTPTKTVAGKFGKTGSPVIGRKRETPHKFLIKSPASPPKFQVKIRSPPAKVRPMSPAAKVVVSAASKLRRSFSPARLASRLVSPMRTRRSCVERSDGVVVSGLKQRPALVSMRHSIGGGRN